MKCVMRRPAQAVGNRRAPCTDLHHRLIDAQARNPSLEWKILLHLRGEECRVRAAGSMRVSGGIVQKWPR